MKNITKEYVTANKLEIYSYAAATEWKTKNEKKKKRLKQLPNI